MKTVSLVISRQQLVALASLLQRPEECAVIEFENLGDGMIYPHRSRLHVSGLSETGLSWMELPYHLAAQAPAQAPAREAGFDFDGDPDPAPDPAASLAAARGESELTAESTRPGQYVITSRPGMTPFATVTNPDAAEHESRKARALGLEGVIVRRQRID